MSKPHIRANMDWTVLPLVIRLAIDSSFRKSLTVIRIQGEKAYKIINTKNEKKMKKPFRVMYRTQGSS